MGIPGQEGSYLAKVPPELVDKIFAARARITGRESDIFLERLALHQAELTDPSLPDKFQRDARACTSNHGPASPDGPGLRSN